MIDEQEAMANWCPMAACLTGSQRCLASDCMAWRWATSDKDETKGFCGMAGVPYTPVPTR